MTEATPVPEELLAHAAFVRKLARSLLQDVNDIEDVEQETWRTVLVRPPGHGQNLQGWLARVTQNFARRSLRSSARRSEHECKAARDGVALSFEAQLAREELLSRVVAAVRSLDEPYRSVILARFYEDLPPRKIAERLRLPVETVHTRVKRALAQLRARLQNVEEDWRSGLVFLVMTGSQVSKARLGTRLSRRVRFSSAVVALLLIGAGLWIALSDTDRPSLASHGTVLVDSPDFELSSLPDPPSQREPAMSLSSELSSTVLATLLSIFTSPRGDGITRLVSVGFDLSGNPAVGNDDSRSSCVSADGRYVAFSSKASNLLSSGADTNGFEDVFVRDLWTEQTFLVSAAPGGADGPSNNPFITPDGEYLFFDSLASNLNPFISDTNGVIDIFRISLASLPSLPPAELVSLTDAGLSSNGHSYAPNASDDGTVVAFSSAASNLTSDTHGPGLDIYVRDLVAGTTVMVSVNNQGVPADRNISEDQAISGDGRYVAFMSNAHNLNLNDTDDEWDVYVFDRLASPPFSSRLTLVSQKFDGSGASGNGASANPCISQDGHYISFTSVADDLVSPGTDTNDGSDVFVRDMWTDQNVLVNRGPGGGVVQVPGVVDNGTMTADGRFLTFYSGSTQYGSHDTNAYWDVYRVDRDRDGNGVFDEPGRTQTKRVSVGPHNEEGDEQSVSSALMATISRNGHSVVFESLASNFAAPLPDTSGMNATYDVFVRDMRTILRR